MISVALRLVALSAGGVVALTVSLVFGAPGSSGAVLWRFLWRSFDFFWRCLGAVHLVGFPLVHWCYYKLVCVLVVNCLASCEQIGGLAMVFDLIHVLRPFAVEY